MIRRFFSSVMAGYLVTFLLFGAALGLAYGRVCGSTQHSWDAIDRVVQAATNPPSKAGQVLTPAQIRALAAYRAQLRNANGPRPSCHVL